MPKVTEVSVRVKASVNLAPYNNVEFDAGMRVTLEEGDDPETVMAEYLHKGKHIIVQQVQELASAGAGVWLRGIADKVPADPQDIEF